MSFMEILYRGVILFGILFANYFLIKQNSYLKAKLTIAEKWESTFNVKQLLDQVKSHKELVETMAGQKVTSEIEKMKKDYGDKLPLTKNDLVKFSQEMTKPIINRYAKTLTALVLSLIVTKREQRCRILDYVRQNNPEVFSDIQTNFPNILQDYIPSDKPFDASELKA